MPYSARAHAWGGRAILSAPAVVEGAGGVCLYYVGVLGLRSAASTAHQAGTLNRCAALCIAGLLLWLGPAVPQWMDWWQSSALSRVCRGNAPLHGWPPLVRLKIRRGLPGGHLLRPHLADVSGCAASSRPPPHPTRDQTYRCPLPQLLIVASGGRPDKDVGSIRSRRTPRPSALQVRGGQCWHLLKRACCQAHPRGAASSESATMGYPAARGLASIQLRGIQPQHSIRPQHSKSKLLPHGAPAAGSTKKKAPAAARTSAPLMRTPPPPLPPCPRPACRLGVCMAQRPPLRRPVGTQGGRGGGG